MGIKGLTSLIKMYSPDSMVECSFDFYSNSIIAIDTSILLYKFRYLSDENSKSHITGFMKKCLKLVSHGITPVFVLDGKPPEEKNEILIKRRNQKNKILEKIKILEEELKITGNKDLKNDINDLKKQIICITKDHKEECEQLLKALGFNVVYSNGEAETMCAKLQENNIVNFTFTDDTDAIVLGCKKVLRSNDSNSFIQINLEKVLKDMMLTYEEFVDLCILCGCDYCPQIPKINYKIAYKLIKEYKTLENVLENIKNEYNVPLNYPYKEARNIFKTSKNNEDCIELKSMNFNEKKLKKVLLDHGFKYNYAENYIKKFKRKINYCCEINNRKKINFIY